MYTVVSCAEDDTIPFALGEVTLDVHCNSGKAAAIEAWSAGLSVLNISRMDATLAVS